MDEAWLTELSKLMDELEYVQFGMDRTVGDAEAQLARREREDLRSRTIALVHVAVLAEREACARHLEQQYPSDPWTAEAAAAIRART